MLALTGLGLVSSVGWGVTPACAAIRAGITRPRIVPGIHVTDRDLLEPVPLMGHPIPTCTEGFGPLGRWMRLAQACLTDLRHTASLPPLTDAHFWQRTGWICVLPHLDAHRFLEVQDFGPELVTTTYLDRLQRVLHLPWRREAVRCIHAGHAGTAAALQIAEQLVVQGQFERIVVLATDSYLDEMSLEWLLGHRRLKTPDRPVGLMPGEAGACLLVESSQAARRRSAQLLATIEAVSTGRESGSILSKQPGNGAALSRAIEQVFTSVPPNSSWEGDLICDLNGEEWRARSWGYAYVRLRSRLKDSVRMLFPCTSLGDVGAASGAVGVCMAARAFARKYANGESALIISSAEHGDVGAVQVRVPGGRA